MLGLCKNINAQILQVRKFDCCEAVSVPESVTSEKVSIKREVE